MDHLSDLPPLAGFVTEPVGTHSSRTIMFADAKRVFDGSPSDASYDDLRRFVIDANILGKTSMSGRTESFRRLRELYGLDLKTPIYAGLRFVWPNSVDEQPLLAMLCTLAREPVLRASAEAVLPVAKGDVLPKADMEYYLEGAFPNRYSAEVLAGMTRRILSSWTQTGHLSGRSRKIRSTAVSGPASTSFALFLGYLQGLRGNRLFETLWVKALDQGIDQIHAYAFEASQKGLINYRRAGDVIDVSFDPFPPAEVAAIKGGTHVQN